MGAHNFVADPEAPVEASDRALGGKADIVFECVGIPGLIAQAVRQARERGTILDRDQAGHLRLLQAPGI